MKTAKKRTLRKKWKGGQNVKITKILPVILAASLMSTLSLAGCAKFGEKSEEAKEKTTSKAESVKSNVKMNVKAKSEQTTEGHKKTAHTKSTKVHEEMPGEVPKELTTIELDAIEIIDHLHNKDWNKAHELFDSTEKAWKGYNPLFKTNQTTSGEIYTITRDLAGLKHYLAEKKIFESSVAANKVSFDAISFMDAYHPMVPTTLKKMNYYVRNAKIMASTGSWSNAFNSYSMSERQWKSIQSQAEVMDTDAGMAMKQNMMLLGLAIQKHDSNLVDLMAQKVSGSSKKIEDAFKKPLKPAKTTEKKGGE